MTDDAIDGGIVAECMNSVSGYDAIDEDIGIAALDAIDGNIDIGRM